MESPVRICLGAAVVVNILLLTSTTVNGSALPHETNPTTITDEKDTKYNRMNSTWSVNSKTPNVALNELHPKESASEEHTEKNAKYKDRGRVKFHYQLRSSTESTLRRIKLSTEPASLVIVTPTPDVKKPSQIIDSMRTYKTKIPDLALSTSTSATILLKADKENQRSKSNDKEGEEEKEEGDEEKDEKEEEEEEDKEEKEEEEKEEERENDDDFKKYTSSKFYGSNLFNMHDNDYKNKKYNQVKEYVSTPSFEKYSSYFSKDTYSSKESKNDEPYKSQSFFDFDSDLTTPKNNLFDKKYHDISTSIMKNLASVKGRSPILNATSPQNIIKENVGIEKFSNGSPNNKSMVIIKNTKEIHLLDNEQAGSANRELSDVQGTSIYYEMSVLSTETYNMIHSSDDDCDNETLPLETTPRVTSQQEEDADALKATPPTIAQVPTKPVFPDSLPGSFSTLQPLLSIIPNSYNTIIPMLESDVPISTQNSIKLPDRPIKVDSSSYTRNRSYSKRLNLTGTKESPNSVTQQTDQALNSRQRPITRKFYYTTPKVKPIWISPRRNITKAHRTTYPTTIYSEHFNIKDKFSTTSRPLLHQKTILTTVSSDIDPVLQSDVSGVKKVVHSQKISDNTIPSLWKRGSMKITTTGAPSTEFETAVSDLEIPPTMTAWALASLRSPPPLSSSVVNVSESVQKSIDENELQKVGEVLDKRETTTVSTKITTTTSTVSTLSNDIISKNITDIVQNKLPWKPVASNVDVNDETVTKSERLQAESNILLQSSLKPSETIQLSQNITEVTTEIAKENQTTPSWILAMYDKDITTTEETQKTEHETIQPVDATKSTGFESITKLPSGVTTPTDENDEIVTEQSTALTTTDYEITTIRYSYVPTEDITESPTPISNEDWHPVIPTRTMATTFENNPITTYSSKFLTTTEVIEETTSVPVDTTPQLEVSSHTLENATQQQSQTIEQSITTYRPKFLTTTEVIEETTSLPVDTTPQLEVSSQTLENATQQQSQTTEKSTTEEITTSRPTTLIPTTESFTDYEETTLVYTTSATLIKTEATTEEIQENTEYLETVTPFAEKQTDSSSEENSDSNEVISQDTISKTSTYATSTTTTTTTLETESATVPITTTIETTSPEIKEHADIVVTTDRKAETTAYTTTEITTKSVNELEDLTSYAEDMTTETSSRVLTEEAGSGAAIAIAVSTIGVIALVLLVGLLLVVRRRGRRGVYAQRCTPVSLDAYSLDSVSVGHRKGNHRLRASKRSYGNPAYDDEVTSHPMQYPALANFALDVESISAEFAEIPSVSVRPEEVPAGCEDKNRYSNVLPLPETRVPLRRIGNDPTTEYINANYVTGPGNIRNYYILCQAPMSNTVVDFWRMIWEQNSRVIVMLTEYMENGVKCYEYLPPSEVSDNKRTFGDYQIILKKREQRDKYAISTVQLINTSTRTWRELTHLWYFWPAKGVPDDYDSVIEFLLEMRSYMKISQTAKEYDEEGVEVIYGDQSRSSYNNLSKLRSDDNTTGNGANVYSPAKAEELLRRANNGTLGRMKAASDIEGVRPCVCVCASGAGRSAAFVALDACARALVAGAADLPRTVRELRAQRPHALANRHHYIFLYKVLSEYGNKLMGSGVDTI
ncbi:unnamed protein product [Parnassius apollo]|uniref:protein-tyrosine-phosphatase n=1 Tax=Parnassius apollo TaxID=110799 RepID=A0A8S3WE55_PARAO|nr:unnamed protein product [Parnassius apollo]